MNWKNEWWKLALIIVMFLACFWLPVGTSRFDGALSEALHLVKWYAREHVLLCLVPAFFIAGAIGVFLSQASVMKYLGAGANKILAYGVASVSGSILAVCSCTVLPLFAGISRMGAGLGPATTFLYSGPAINVLAIVLTARVLGLELGIARAVGAILFSIIIGLLMHFIFRNEHQQESQTQATMPDASNGRPLWQTVVYFAAMIGVLVSVNWGCCGPGQIQTTAFGRTVYALKWPLTAVFSASLGVILVLWFKVRWWKVAAAATVTALAVLLFPHQPLVSFTVGLLALSMITSTNKSEAGEWFSSSWGFAKQILPLLLLGVLVAGFLLGRPGHEGMIPSAWVHRALGGNSLWANLFAAVAGAFMYFATLTEVPILRGLLDAGMGKGPALALLLAGPALSLPNMLVIRSVMGTKKTAVFVLLVIVMATLSGILFGAFF